MHITAIAIYMQQYTVAIQYNLCNVTPYTVASYLYIVKRLHNYKAIHCDTLPPYNFDAMHSNIADSDSVHVSLCIAS